MSHISLDPIWIIAASIRPKDSNVGHNSRWSLSRVKPPRAHHNKSTCSLFSNRFWANGCFRLSWRFRYWNSLFGNELPITATLGGCILTTQQTWRTITTAERCFFCLQFVTRVHSPQWRQWNGRPPKATGPSRLLAPLSWLVRTTGYCFVVVSPGQVCIRHTIHGCKTTFEHYVHKSDLGLRPKSCIYITYLVAFNLQKACVAHMWVMVACELWVSLEIF